MEDVTRPVPTLLGATSVAVGVAIHLTRMITAVTVSHHACHVTTMCVCVQYCKKVDDRFGFLVTVVFLLC